MKIDERFVLEYREFLSKNKSQYDKLFEEYSNQSKYFTFKSFIKNKAKDAKAVSKNVFNAFKKEGVETADMLDVFNRQIRKKLNLRNRKDNPTPEELTAALKQLRDIPKLLPFATVMLAAPIPGSSTMYTVFAYFLKKKSRGKIDLLPDSFDDVLDVKDDKISKE
jgi:hypothetical protein